MAFSRTGWNPVGGQSKKGSGNALWFYSSADAIATVRAAGYFNDVSDEVSVRDVIVVTDTNTPTTNLVNVLSNASGVVDVSDGTAIVETDSD
uniref:Uncharacterized protein n=1 Tax=uncultured marine virus TaxID=186617 RepID=A0A0F7L8F9_9VIRU|nr:hypothetical protein [uncultured marine virus]